MKRDMDLIRSLLLKLEALPIESGGIVVLQPGGKEIVVEGYSEDQIDYHLSLLKEIGLIECPGSGPMIGITFRRLTWAGHDYLDAVRDPEIWKKTKQGTEAVGSFTFDLVKDLAKGLIRTQIEKHTGVKL